MKPGSLGTRLGEGHWNTVVHSHRHHLHIINTYVHVHILKNPYNCRNGFNLFASEKIRTDSRIREIQALTPFN